MGKRNTGVRKRKERQRTGRRKRICKESLKSNCGVEGNTSVPEEYSAARGVDGSLERESREGVGVHDIKTCLSESKLTD